MLLQFQSTTTKLATNGKHNNDDKELKSKSLKVFVYSGKVLILTIKDWKKKKTLKFKELGGV